MINDLKIALAVSILFHVSVFLLTAYKSKSIIYLNLPVELFLYNAPSPVTSSGDVVTKDTEKEKEKEEIKVPKKVKKEAAAKKKTKLAPKKEAPPEAKPEVSSAKTGTGNPAPAHLVPSGQISLESAQFPYAYYTSMLVKKISRNWQWAVEFGRLKTIIYFKIQKDGSLTDVAIKEGSGDSLFDQQAIRAVKLCDPFPPLPDGYPENNLGVFFEFSFKE